MGIFVSYSHLDKEIVSQIVDIVLSCSKEEIWYDAELRGGDRYFSVIAREIRKNDIFLFMVSEHSVCSDWCTQELQFAMSEHKKIIAVWLEDITLPAEVKFIIQNTHYIVWNQDKKQFEREMIRCFSEKMPSEQANQTVDEESLRAPVTDKYFIPKEKMKQIESLLAAECENKYSLCFKSENAVLLGLAYEIGIHTEKDFLKAKFYYQVGKFYRNVDAQYLYASLLLEENPENKEEYLSEMKEAAEQGGFYAMTSYGDICYDGKYGVAQDKDYAISFWQKAAEAGSAQAQYYMAYSHRWGIGVEKNPCLALMYALKSVEYEFPRAYRILALIYEFGEFVATDLERAKMYYQEAISRKDLLSVCMLGSIYYYDDKNYDESIKLFRQAVTYADEGKISSGKPYYLYGMSLFYGDGIEKDAETAIDYYFKAVEKNYKSAKEYIVDLICDTYSGDRQIELLKKASGLNCRQAEYWIGNYYLSKEDFDTAIAWFNNGAEKGCADCLNELIKTYSFVIGDKKRSAYEDRSLALKYYQMLFSLPEVEMYVKGVLDVYYYAYGVELAYDKEHPDIDLAIYYFEKSLVISMNFLKPIIIFAIDGFLFPEVSDSGLKKSVVYCEKILSKVQKYIKQYHNQQAELSLLQPDDSIDDLEELYKYCRKGYRHMAEMYRRGKGVKRDKEKASRCLQLSEMYHSAEEHCAVGVRFEEMSKTYFDVEALLASKSL